MSAKYLYQLPQLKETVRQLRKLISLSELIIRRLFLVKRACLSILRETNIILFVRIMVRNIMTQ